LIINKLKAKKLDRNLQELFRHNLENAEITPDPSVGVKLMRKLAVREFLHFNPFRFNIYYLGGIVAAGIAAVLILSSSHDHKNQVGPQEILNQSPIKENSENIIIIPDQAPINISTKDGGKASSSVRKSSFAVKEDANVKTIVPTTQPRESFNIKPDTIDKSLKRKELFARAPENNFKLQDMTRSGEKLFEPSVGEGCAPLKVQFQNNLDEQDSCFWTFGDGGSSVARNPEWIYDVEGEYKVVLKVFGSEGLISSSSSVISVFPTPTARFEISPDRLAIPGDEVRFQNYSAGAVKYFWSFGDGNSSEQFEPLHRYEKYGNYNVSLKVYSENGCSDSLVVFNAFSGSAYFIEFPNAFIPNTAGPSGGVYSSKSDESAQVFHPSFSGVSDYHLMIFSKLGILLFETNDTNIGWDGYFKSQLCNPGVYIWKVRGNFSNGEPFTKMGDVTLLKN
jgi:PKD repeat protein